jgi:hypothetical protein
MSDPQNPAPSPAPAPAPASGPGGQGAPDLSRLQDFLTKLGAVGAKVLPILTQLLFLLQQKESAKASGPAAASHELAGCHYCADCLDDVIRSEVENLSTLLHLRCCCDEDEGA